MQIVFLFFHIGYEAGRGAGRVGRKDGKVPRYVPETQTTTNALCWGGMRDWGIERMCVCVGWEKRNL